MIDDEKDGVVKKNNLDVVNRKTQEGSEQIRVIAAYWC